MHVQSDAIEDSLQILISKRSKRSNPNDSPKRLISSIVFTVANIFTMLFPKKGKRLKANGTWKITFRRRRDFSRFPYLEKYIAVKGSIVRPLVDVPWNERRERKFRFDDAKFDDGVGGSSQDITKGCVSFQLSLSLSLETVEQWPKTVADFLPWYPLPSLSPDNGRFYLQLTESRCFFASRRRESEGEIRGEISSSLWRNMNFYFRAGLRLI